MNTAELPIAKKVEGLAGYVRTPFTNPPRLVDVRGMNAGAKVVCPYTRKPFLVPAGANPIPTASIAVAPAPSAPAQITPAPLPRIEPAPMRQEPVKVVQQIPKEPTKVAANNVAPAPAPAPPVRQPTPAPSVAPVASPPPAPADNGMPFGAAVPGRPGFVNSPFAAKHQLVDVTGLPTGMEVKCPYTGKLFRVPPQANAQP